MKITLLFFLLFATIANAQNNPTQTMNQADSKNSKRQIVFKFDDLIAKDDNIKACSRTFDYCVKNKIKASWGVEQMEALTETQKQIIQNYLKAENDKGEKLFELWHHGLDHSRNKPEGTWEFKGTGYDMQKEHFVKADEIIKKQFGLQMHTFGSPFNADDSVTSKVLAENQNYNVVLLGSAAISPSKNLINLNQRVNIESKTGIIEFSCFIADYNLKKDKLSKVMVLQAHPPYFKENGIEELDKIVRFLQAEGYEFVLPFEYYQANNHDVQ